MLPWKTSRPPAATRIADWRGWDAGVLEAFRPSEPQPKHSQRSALRRRRQNAALQHSPRKRLTCSSKRRTCRYTRIAFRSFSRLHRLAAARLGSSATGKIKMREASRTPARSRSTSLRGWPRISAAMELKGAMLCRSTPAGGVCADTPFTRCGTCSLQRRRDLCCALCAAGASLTSAARTITLVSERARSFSKRRGRILGHPQINARGFEGSAKAEARAASAETTKS